MLRFNKLAFQFLGGAFIGLAIVSSAWARRPDVQAGHVRPRPGVIKPERTAVGGQFEPAVISVKFRDGLLIRLRGGRLTDLGTGALLEAQAAFEQLAGARWQRITNVDEARIDQVRARAEQSLGRAIADLNLYFHLHLPAGVSAADAIDLLNGLECVELAMPIPLPPPPPVPDDFQQLQRYLYAAPGGVEAVHAWDALAVYGAGVRIADIEYSWNQKHQDLPAISILGPTTLINPFSDSHGTAVLGELFGIDNGFGITGIANQSEPYFIGVMATGVWDVAGAILTSLGTLQAGDVLLIEQQVAGPLGGSWYVPVEWRLDVYNAVLAAVGNGIIVVEPAGNGAQNLDNPPYSTGNYGHAPFLAENDSGAIMVGAGAAPNPFGSTVDRSRLSFSTYGSRVNLQGWGESVWTLGYGDAYSANGSSLWYTDSFGGTSSASPIIAGAAALVQSAFLQTRGWPASPWLVRQILIDTGSPQQSGIFPASQHIGPRPHVKAALLQIMDCNDNGIVDLEEIINGSAEDCDGNGVPDACDLPADASFDSGLLSPIGSGLPQTFTMLLPPAALEDVTLTFQASADLNEVGERITVYLNDSILGSIFSSGAGDCPPQPDIVKLKMSSNIFNAAIEQGGGLVAIRMEPSASVDAAACGGASHIRVMVAYVQGTTEDLNSDGIPDICLPVSVDADLNDDGLVNGFDLGILLAHWSIPVGWPACEGASPCAADINADGVIDGVDLGLLLAAWTI